MVPTTIVSSLPLLAGASAVTTVGNEEVASGGCSRVEVCSAHRLRVANQGVNVCTRIDRVRKVSGEAVVEVCGGGVGGLVQSHFCLRDGHHGVGGLHSARATGNMQKA